MMRDIYNHPNDTKIIGTNSSSSKKTRRTRNTKRIARRHHLFIERKQNQVKEKSKLLKRIFQCCLLNGGIFGCSCILFEYAILPLIELSLFLMFNPGTGLVIGHYVVRFLSIIFGTLWVLPLFILSKIVNSFLFQDIADVAFKFRKGQPQSTFRFSVFVAETLFSFLVQTLFLLQCMVINWLESNYFGIVCNMHLCLLYSFYSIDYKWCNMGWRLQKRFTYIEKNWAYFLGFGTTLSILTQMTSSTTISCCIFAVFFPFYILSANEATPVTTARVFPIKIFDLAKSISNALLERR